MSLFLANHRRLPTDLIPGRKTYPTSANICQFDELVGSCTTVDAGGDSKLGTTEVRHNPVVCINSLLH